MGLWKRRFHDGSGYQPVLVVVVVAVQVAVPVGDGGQVVVPVLPPQQVQQTVNQSQNSVRSSSSSARRASRSSVANWDARIMFLISFWVSRHS